MNYVNIFICSNIYNLYNSNIYLYDKNNKLVDNIVLKSNNIKLKFYCRGIHKLIIKKKYHLIPITIYIKEKGGNIYINLYNNKTLKNIIYLFDSKYEGLKIEKGLIYLNG